MNERPQTVTSSRWLNMLNQYSGRDNFKDMIGIVGVLHGEAACKDFLSVTEGSRLLMNKCGEIEEPIVIESSDNELNVTLSVKSEFYGKRGLLAHFTGMIIYFISNRHRFSNSTSQFAQLTNEDYRID